jgi:hypothetical protein
MTKKVTMTRGDARVLLRKVGIDVNGRDYHQLRSSEVEQVLAVAKLYRYRKSKNAPGSTARMFYEYLRRAR